MDWLGLVNGIGEGPFKVAILFSITYGARELAKMRKSLERLHISTAIRGAEVKGIEKRVTKLELKT